MGVGELDLQLVCCVGAWVREISYPHPFSPVAGSTAGPGLLRMGKQAMSLPNCNTLESRPYTLPGQGRAGPG